MRTTRLIFRLGRVALLAALIVAAAPAFSAADKIAAPLPKRPFVGKSTGPDGNMLRRTKAGKWLPVKNKQDIFPGNLLMAGAGASLENAKGTVRVSFLGDLSNSSPLPIIETAVVLNPPVGVDLDLTVDRGRVDMTNIKKKGAAKVRVHVQDESAEVILNEPGARIAIEVLGRWAAGAPFVKKPKPGYGPGLEIVLLVLQGTVEVKHGTTVQMLTAPPGPAFMHLDSTAGLSSSPKKLDKVPDWATEKAGDSEAGRKRKAAFEKLRKLVLAKGIGETLDELVESDDPAERRLAVFAMGAIDDLERLGNALNHAKHPDVWENGVLALRHWIGRAPGQDQILFKALQERRGYSPANAETVIELLHGFGEAKLSQPETFEILIAYLNHDKLGIRALAHWHLVRLVPGGREIKYDPLGTAAEHVRGQKEWRKLVPHGTLPKKAAAKAGS